MESQTLSPVRSRARPSVQERGICVTVADPSLIGSRTELRQGAELRLTDEVGGVVRAASPGGLVIDTGWDLVRVDAFFPEGTQLDELIGQQVQLTIEHIHKPRLPTTVDAKLWNDRGVLLLWARDGQPPEDCEVNGTAVRVCAGRREAAVAFCSTVTRQRLLLVEGGVGRYLHGGERYSARVLRVAINDVSFILVAGS